MACGKYFRAYLVGGFSAIGGFLFGYHTGVISGVLVTPGFANITKLNNSNSNNSVSIDLTSSSIVAVLLFGCFLGSLIGGQTSDRFSRKYSISIFSFIFTIGAALQTGSTPKTGLPMLLVARFISGKMT
jgi:MFS family permease